MANGTNTYTEQLGASYVVPQLDTVQYNEHYQQLMLAYQKVSAEKEDLESFIAMMAHQFYSPLQSIEYNVEYQNDKKGILESVWTMSSLLEKMTLFSKKPEKLRKALLQDMHGECTLISVLEKSLSLAFTELLTINNRDKIIQHFMFYAKKREKYRKQQHANNGEIMMLILLYGNNCKPNGKPVLCSYQNRVWAILLIGQKRGYFP